MNIMIFSDPHAKKDELQECELVFNELVKISDDYKIDLVINAGDTYDFYNPGSESIDLFANFVKKLNKRIIIIAAKSHESTTPEDNILNHFGILNEMVTVVKEYIDPPNLFVGHFSIKESCKNYDAIKSKEDFRHFKHVVLGHVHHHDIIKPNVCHIGSCRWINFDEVRDKQKLVLIIQNYGETTEKCHFLALKSPYKMKTVYLTTQDLKPQEGCLIAKSIEEIGAYLDSMPSLTKIKVKIQDFSLFKQYLTIEQEYQNKFIKYERENEFITQIAKNNTEISTEKKNLKESLKKFLEERNTDPDVKKAIEDTL